MSHTIVVPELGESVVEATVGKWLRKVGDRVEVGDVLVELETDKANLEVGAEHAGVLSKIENDEGTDVQIGDALGVIEVGAEATDSSPAASDDDDANDAEAEGDDSASATGAAAKASPAARRLAREHDVDLAEVEGTGSGRRIKRDDVERYLGSRDAAPAASGGNGNRGAASSDAPREAAAAPAGASSTKSAPSRPAPPAREPGERRERRVKMSRRRQTIARRLVESQHTAAILTTFNEIDMTAVMELRARRKQAFEERFGTRLGFMSFFTKAAIAALRSFPELNAEIQGNEIVYKDYYDIGIAVGAEDGLVVPVLRDADFMSFADVESTIREYGKKAQAGTLSIDEITGGTFTISNGGVFGSLLATPIINPPQVGILGLHKIEDRPIVKDGEIVIRSMMYCALSYDHRIVDGRESVQFLKLVKEMIEDPGALLLESSGLA